MVVVIVSDAEDGSRVTFQELSTEAEERALAIFSWADYTIEIQR